MNLADLQLDVDERLAAVAALANVPRLVELDPRKTPDELAAAEQAFETALLTKGIVIVILSPFGRPIDATRRAVAWALKVPIAVIENPEVNRGTADASATPPRAPLGLRPLAVQQEIITALLAAYKFPDEAPLERPTQADGLVHYYLLPTYELKVA